MRNRRALSPIVKVVENTTVRARPVRRLTSPERWELKQLQAAGLIDAREAAGADDFGGGGGSAPGVPDELEEEVEIVMVEDEPLFLRGKTKAAMDLSPIRVVANPEGSMLRAAMTQGM